MIDLRLCSSQETARARKKRRRRRKKTCFHGHVSRLRATHGRARHGLAW